MRRRRPAWARFPLGLPMSIFPGQAASITSYCTFWCRRFVHVDHRWHVRIWCCLSCARSKYCETFGQAHWRQTSHEERTQICGQVRTPQQEPSQRLRDGLAEMQTVCPSDAIFRHTSGCAATEPSRTANGWCGDSFSERLNRYTLSAS